MVKIRSISSKVFQYFQNQTRGLFGNWTFDIQDDFTLPNGQYGSTFTTSNLDAIHKNFALKCKWTHFLIHSFPFC